MMESKKKDITKNLIKFAHFLNLIWSDVSNIINNDVDVDDEYEQEKLLRGYIQSTWEFLVERVVCKEGHFLDVYSEGADIYDLSERVSFPYKKGKIHQIKFSLEKKSINLLTQKNVNSGILFDFDKFVSFDNNGFFSEEPPFDKVLGYHIESDEQYIFEISDVNFYLF